MYKHESDLPAWLDKNNPLNGPKYWTGKKCIEDDCFAPAGTAWSPYWCFRHNVERMNKIDASLNAIAKDFGIEE